MSLSVSNVLTCEEVEYINNLPEVLRAKEQIDAKYSGSVYFTIPLTSAMKSALYERLGLNVMAMESIPMRWIKGDTSAHIDTGVRSFEKTHLVYLTDSPGELVLDTTVYPITRGTGYVFPESVRHETVHTGSEPRLLVGPMSEEGFAVGIGNIFGPGGTTLYIRQFGGNYEYSSDQTSWLNFYFPTYVTNTDTTAGILTVEFVSDITFTSGNDYFVCGSSHIQFGSTSLKTDGTRPILTIDGVANYPGLLQNGNDSGNGYNNIYIYNLVVNTINGSTLYSSGGRAGGWFGQYYFGKGATDNYIINCSSDGNLPGGTSGSGGIVGSHSAINSGSELYIIGCSSSGTIGQLDGGIVGAYAGQNGGSVYCSQCWATGLIQAFGGGIFGDYAGDSGYAQATNCYTTGAIGNNGGGIFGRFAGNAGTAVAQASYSLGNVGTEGGGIFSIGAGSDSGTTSATNCYSAGTIATSGRGIYGTGKANGTETNCYVANGSWVSSNANLSLQGVPAPVVGTTWVSTGVNQPYELRTMGYTPYTITNISATPSLVRIFASTLTSGNSTGGGIISGLSYAILVITGGDAGSYASITMNSTTGAITTTSSTVPGIYTIYVRNTGSYNITEYELTVSSGGGGDVNNVTCCSRPLYINGVDYSVRTNIIAGNSMIGNTSTRKYPMFSSDLLKMQQAYASKR